MSVLKSFEKNPARIFAAGSLLITEGGQPGSLFVLESGEVEVLRNGIVVATCHGRYTPPDGSTEWMNPNSDSSPHTASTTLAARAGMRLRWNTADNTSPATMMPLNHRSMMKVVPIAARQPERCSVIDADQAPDAVTEAVWDLVSRRLSL